MRSFKISVIKLLSVLTVMLMLGTSIAFAQVSVTFPTVSGAVGSSTTVPITVGDLTGQNVASYQFTLFYDKNIIDVTGIETAGTKSESGQISSNTDLANGKLLVAWANMTQSPRRLQRRRRLRSELRIPSRQQLGLAQLPAG